MGSPVFFFFLILITHYTGLVYLRKINRLFLSHDSQHNWVKHSAKKIVFFFITYTLHPEKNIVRLQRCRVVSYFWNTVMRLVVYFSSRVVYYRHYLLNNGCHFSVKTYLKLWSFLSNYHSSHRRLSWRPVDFNLATYINHWFKELQGAIIVLPVSL